MKFFVNFLLKNLDFFLVKHYNEGRVTEKDNCEAPLAQLVEQ